MAKTNRRTGVNSMPIGPAAFLVRNRAIRARMIDAVTRTALLPEALTLLRATQAFLGSSLGREPGARRDGAER